MVQVESPVVETAARLYNEFSKPLKAMGILTYGESTQPGSPHIGNQLPLLSKKQLRPTWRTRAEVEGHLQDTKTY
jgi:acyl-homoserine-lactone acylase